VQSDPLSKKKEEVGLKGEGEGEGEGEFEFERHT
jgi:hypothetical protein